MHLIGHALVPAAGRPFRTPPRAALPGIVRAIVFLVVLGSAPAFAQMPFPASRAVPAGRRVPTPRDSYLSYKVYSCDQLEAQLRDSPRLLNLYARHFHVSPERLRTYFQRNLVESYVPQTRRCPVYCVRPSGQIYVIHQTFRRGTKVFALRNGQPVLKWVCGNPLSRALPAVVARRAASAPAANPVVAVKPSVEELTFGDAEDVIVPSETEAPVFAATVPTALPGATAISLPAAGGGFPLLPILAGGATGIVLATGGHGSTGETPALPSGTAPLLPPGQAPDSPPAALTPETDSFWLLALALLPLAGLAARRPR